MGDSPSKTTTILGDRSRREKVVIICHSRHIPKSLGSQAFAMSSAGRSPTAGVPEASWGQRRYRFCQGKSGRVDIHNWYPPWNKPLATEVMSVSNIRNLQTSMGRLKFSGAISPKGWNISTPFCNSGLGLPGPDLEMGMKIGCFATHISSTPSMTQVYLGPFCHFGEPQMLLPESFSVWIHHFSWHWKVLVDLIHWIQTRRGEFRFQDFLLPCYQLTRVHIPVPEGKGVSTIKTHNIPIFRD